MSTQEQIYLLDNLQSLLEQQIETARRGDFRRLEVLAEQTASVVADIVDAKAFKQPKFNGRRKLLTKLYEELELICATEKDSVAKQLRQIDNVRKTLHIYHNNS